jgi:hypothetical protein
MPSESELPEICYRMLNRLDECEAMPLPPSVPHEPINVFGNFPSELQAPESWKLCSIRGLVSLYHRAGIGPWILWAGDIPLEPNLAAELTAEGRGMLAAWRIDMMSEHAVADRHTILKEGPTAIAEAANQRGDATKSTTTPSENNEPHVEWSAPMSKTEMARRITGDHKARPRKVETLLQRWGLQRVNGNSWRIRLDKLDAATREKIEKTP